MCPGTEEEKDEYFLTLMKIWIPEIFFKVLTKQNSSSFFIALWAK